MLSFFAGGQHQHLNLSIHLLWVQPHLTTLASTSNSRRGLSPLASSSCLYVDGVRFHAVPLRHPRGTCTSHRDKRVGAAATPALSLCSLLSFKQLEEAQRGRSPSLASHGSLCAHWNEAGTFPGPALPRRLLLPSRLVRPRQTVSSVATDHSRPICGGLWKRRETLGKGRATHRPREASSCDGAEYVQPMAEKEEQSGRWLFHTSCRELGRPATLLSSERQAGSLILALADLPASNWPPFVNAEHSLHTKALRWRHDPRGFGLAAGKVTQRDRHRPKNSQHLAAAERNEERVWRMGIPRVPCSDTGHRPLSTFAIRGWRQKHTMTDASQQDSAVALATVYITAGSVNGEKVFECLIKNSQYSLNG